MIFPIPWLKETARSDPHAEFNGNTPDNKQRKTNHDVQAEGFLRRVAITRPQRLLGHISQMVAAMTHRVQQERLVYIAANIPKIVIVTGDDDRLVYPSGSERIKKGMDAGLDEAGRKRVEYIKWENTGHGIHAQREEEFNALVERCLREGKAAVQAGFKGRDV
jgi:pimeloyl-ACP methyl ester carboxylesterase